MNKNSLFYKFCNINTHTQWSYSVWQSNISFYVVGWLAGRLTTESGRSIAAQNICSTAIT